MTSEETSILFTVEGVRKLHGWTHSCLNVVLDHMSTIPADDYAKELPHFGFPTLRQQVIHVFNCEGFWIQTLQGSRHIDWTPDQFPTIADARRLQQQVTARTHAYLSSLSDHQVNTDTELHFPDGDIAVRTPALVLHHVLTHAFHHKGQMVAMCRVLGHPAHDTDLNQFE
jgi:uncharacterized damage-inducible protein DinB